MLRPHFRALRLAAARTVAACVHAVPSTEPLFRHVGRALKRSRHLSHFYWLAADRLVERRRDSPHRFRRLDIAGLPLDLDATTHGGALHYFHGEPYEPELTAIVASLRPGDVFVDIGANVGFFSLVAAKRLGTRGRVIAFEPHPGARARMQAVLERNHVTTVEIVPAAVADADGATLRLYLTGQSELSTLNPVDSPMANVRFDAHIDVPSVTLDRWLETRGIDPETISLIKIDVEGAEGRVIAGMRDTLARARHATRAVHHPR